MASSPVWIPLKPLLGVVARRTWYADAWPVFQSVQAAASRFTPQFLTEVAKDILVHTLAVTALDGLSRLVGAADGDLAYFHHPDRNEFYIFDSVEGGNGCAETIERFLQIPPLRRILAARGGGAGTLPSADGFMLIEETLARLSRAVCDASPRGDLPTWRGRSRRPPLPKGARRRPSGTDSSRVRSRGRRSRDRRQLAADAAGDLRRLAGSALAAGRAGAVRPFARSG